jgi:hypothetical protein
MRMIMPAGSGKPTPFITSSDNQSNGQISADGKWAAYASDESGNWEIYVTSFPWRDREVAGLARRRNRTALARRRQRDLLHWAQRHVDGSFGQQRK